MVSEDSPWQPASLQGRDDLEDFAYVIVEEEIDETLGLVVAEWPDGGRGAPRFHDKGEFELAVDREEMQRHLVDRQMPQAEVPDAVLEELRRREIRVGDVFAIKPVEPLAPEDPDQVQTAEWMGETLDLTAEAREAARAKTYEALTPPLDPEVAEQLIASDRATEPEETT
jgi:hypothetical protein